MAVVVLVLVLIGMTGRSAPKKPSLGSSSSPSSSIATISPALAREVTSVPASVLNAVGIDGQPITSTPGANPVNLVTAAAAKSAALPRVDGKPVLFFVSFEWCPFCAIERWSLIVALSRFGTFSGLGPAASSPTDLAPDTQTFTFVHSHFTSQYLTFAPVELQNASGAPLQSPTAAEQAVLAAWDVHENVPFFDLGGRYMGGAPSWLSPTLLHGLSRTDIAGLLYEQSSPIGRLIEANANYITAAICNLDGGEPASVCSTPAVQAGTAQLRHDPAAVPIS